QDIELAVCTAAHGTETRSDGLKHTPPRHQVVVHLLSVNREQGAGCQAQCCRRHPELRYCFPHGGSDCRKGRVVAHSTRGGLPSLTTGTECWGCGAAHFSSPRIVASRPAGAAAQ